MLDTKRMRFPLDIILVCIRWYVAYPLCCRHLEEMMQERGVFVDHTSISRWAKKLSMDKSGSNKAAIDQIIEDNHLSITVRQVK